MISKNLRRVLGITLASVMAVSSFNVMPEYEYRVMTAKAATSEDLGSRTEYRARKVVNVDAMAKCNGNKYVNGSGSLNTLSRANLWGTFNVNGKKDNYIYKSSSQQEVVTFTVGNTQWKGVLTRIAYGIKGRNYYYNNDYYYVYAIVGVEPAGDLKSSVITLPSTISVSTKAGEQVKATCVELAPYAFAGKNITKVNIPDTYQRICDGAFADCTELQSVQIVTLKNDGFTIDKVGDGSSLHTLGSYAFAGCSSLKTPYLPDSLIKLGEIADSEPQWGDSVCVPNTSKSPYENERGQAGYNKYYMGKGVFQDCYGIERVELGNDKLKEVYVPEDTFAGCTSLADLKIDDNVTKLVIGKSAFAGSEGGAGNKLSTLEFNCDVILDSFAFSNCNKLGSVKFKKGFNNPDLMGYDTRNLENHDNVYHRYSKLYAGTGNFYGIFKDSFDENNSNTGMDISPCDTKEGKKIIIPNGFLEGSNISKVSITGTTGGVDEASLEIDKYAFKNTVLRSFEIKVNNLKLDNHSLYGINTATLKLSANEKIETVGEVFADTFKKPVSENNINIKKIIFDAPVVDFGYGTISNPQMREDFGTSSTFYGVGDNASLIFGKNVEKVTGFNWYKDTVTYTDNGAERSALHKALGDIKSVYITSPKTKIAEKVLQDKSSASNYKDYSYTLYGYKGVLALKGDKESDLTYSDIAEESKNISFKEYIEDVLVTQNAPVIVDSFNDGSDLDKYLEVDVQFSDDTSEKLSYKTDGKDGYTISESSLEKIKSYANKLSSTVSVPVTFEYSGVKKSESIQLAKKAITSFEVAPKSGKSFVEGTTVTPQDLTITNVKYNDGTSVPALSGGETVTVSSNPLVMGTNTVQVTLDGVTVPCNIQAVQKSVVSLSAIRTNTVLYEGETLENTDFEVTAYYNNGDVVNNFKDFEILTKDKLTLDTKLATIALKGNENIATVVNLNVKNLVPQYINASYTGDGVIEGQDVKKENIKVTLFYSNNMSRVLKDDEYSLVYTKIIGGIENAVRIIYNADTTKMYTITVLGLKATQFDTPAPVTVPPKTTEVPTSTPVVTKAPTTGSTEVPVPTNNGTTPTATPVATAPTTEIPVPTESSVPVTTPQVPNAQPNVTKKSVKITVGVGEKLTVKAKTPFKSYKSENSKIAIVNSKGVITAKKIGKTTITVVDKDNNSLKVTLTVKKAPKKVSVNFTKKTLKPKKKATIKIKYAKGYYSNKVTFTSSNKKIATVNSKGIITARKKGTCKITVKTYNGKKAVVKVTVK